MFQSRISPADARAAVRLLDPVHGRDGLKVRVLAPREIEDALPALRRLRAELFGQWPYLYEPQDRFERGYLRAFARTEGAVLAVALDGDRIVGVATASPLLAQEPDVITPLATAGWDVRSIFYFGESLLLPDYRGQGVGHIFFDLRERQALAAGARHAIFGSVIRPDDHPRRPVHYSPLDPFWRGRGYRPLDKIDCNLLWQDIGATAETPHPMRLWHRDLQTIAAPRYGVPASSITLTGSGAGRP